MLPKNVSQLETIQSLNKNTIDFSGERILACVKSALDLEQSELPVTAKPKRLTADQEVIADLLMTQLKLIANEQNISPTNIASRKDIEKTITEPKNSPLLKGWRYQVAGEKIQDLLDGKHSLQISDGKVWLKKITS